MQFKYFLEIEDGQIIACAEALRREDIGIDICVEVSKEVYDNWQEDKLLYVWDGENIVLNPNYQADKQAQIRAEKDNMTLTPSDVERALLAAKGWDFEDLKQYLKNEHGYTDLQIKAIGVELRANDFYRGAVLKGTNIRIVDTIGALLGYDSDDMDYLFEHKELPIKNNQTDAQQQPLNENDFLEDEIPF